ncbi:MAG: hypothetical protein EOO73_11615 [Myxococcales bacterium]|nr:MAG: hypothetical protein EOO73_11615 [Myxococcales bacterium]
MNRLGVWARVALLGAVVGSCGQTSASSGSNSNWLGVCDSAADCGSGLECWCNVCSKPCRSVSDCAGPASTCAESTSTGCGEAVPTERQVCTAECDSQRQCSEIDEALVCVAGACVRSGGASGGGSGSGGGANAGGSKSSGGSATTGGSGVGSAASNVPADDRPARPEWNPPFAIGAPGWRSSTGALCEHHQGRQDAFDVWADSRGVYAVFSAVCNVLAGDPCGKQGISLQHNDGSGWSHVYALPPGPGMGSTGSLYLSGFESGPLLLSGILEERAGLWQIDESGKASLGSELGMGRPFVVGPDLAYALGESAVLRFAEGKWSEYLESPAHAQAVWADDDVVIVVGIESSVYMSQSGAPFVEVAGAPAGDYGSVWAYGADDIWAGNAAGQLAHYDGETWQTISTGSVDTSGSGIEQIWGSDDGPLFFRTRLEMGIWNGSEVRLFQLDSEPDSASRRVSTSGLWGLSSEEVFLAVSDRELRDYQCGEQFLLYFDGEEFHPF